MSLHSRHQRKALLVTSLDTCNASLQVQMLRLVIFCQICDSQKSSIKKQQPGTLNITQFIFPIQQLSTYLLFKQLLCQDLSTLLSNSAHEQPQLADQATLRKDLAANIMGRRCSAAANNVFQLLAVWPFKSTCDSYKPLDVVVEEPSLGLGLPYWAQSPSIQLLSPRLRIINIWNNILQDEMDFLPLPVFKT